MRWRNKGADLFRLSQTEDNEGNLRQKEKEQDRTGPPLRERQENRPDGRVFFDGALVSITIVHPSIATH
jgi:hypothetical protein